jgi:hypothetical protein
MCSEALASTVGISGGRESGILVVVCEGLDRVTSAQDAGEGCAPALYPRQTKES